MYLVVTERTWTSGNLMVAPGGKATGKFKSLGIVNGKCFFLNVFQSALLMSLPGERTMAVESHNWVVKYWWLGLVSTRAAIVVNNEFYFSNVRWHIVVLTEWKISHTRILECWHSAFFPVSPCDLTWMQLQSTFLFARGQTRLVCTRAIMEGHKMRMLMYVNSRALKVSFVIKVKKKKKVMLE